jgi:membrane protein YdbS with pleckstrin-like domain
LEFSNQQIQIDMLPKFENLNLEPIAPRYFLIILANIIITYGNILIVLFVTNHFFSDDPEYPAHLFWLFFGVVCFIGLCHLVLLRLGFNKRKYALREKDVIYSSGYIINKTMTLPFNRIQHIEISRSFMARKLGLSTLRIYSAGESGGDMTIAGLPKAVADAQYAFLTKIVNERV